MSTDLKQLKMYQTVTQSNSPYKGKSSQKSLQPRKKDHSNSNKQIEIYEKCVSKAIQLLCEQVTGGLKPLDMIKTILSSRSTKKKETEESELFSEQGRNEAASKVTTPLFNHEEEANLIQGSNFDERSWAKKMWKIYRMLTQLEKSKIGGLNFSDRLRDIATYFAIKYRMLESNVEQDQDIVHEVQVEAQLPQEQEIQEPAERKENQQVMKVNEKVDEKVDVEKEKSQTNYQPDLVTQKYEIAHLMPDVDRIASLAAVQNDEAIMPLPKQENAPVRVVAFDDELDYGDLEEDSREGLNKERPRTIDATMKTRPRPRTQAHANRVPSSAVSKVGSMSSMGYRLQPGTSDKTFASIMPHSRLIGKQFKKSSVHNRFIKQMKNEHNQSQFVPVLWNQKRKQSANQASYFMSESAQQSRKQMFHNRKASNRSDMVFETSLASDRVANRRKQSNWTAQQYINNGGADNRVQVRTNLLSQNSGHSSTERLNVPSQVSAPSRQKIQGFMRNNSQPRANTRLIQRKEEVNQTDNQLTDFMINDMQNMYKRRQPSQQSEQKLSFVKVINTQAPYENMSHTISETISRHTTPQPVKQERASDKALKGYYNQNGRLQQPQTYILSNKIMSDKRAIDKNDKKKEIKQGDKKNTYMLVNGPKKPVKFYPAVKLQQSQSSEVQEQIEYLAQD